MGDKETCAKRIKSALHLRDMTQADLCRNTGIPKSAMSQYCNGRLVPRQDRTYLIAKALDVSEAWLMGYNVSMERKTTPISLEEEQRFTRRFDLLTQSNLSFNELSKKTGISVHRLKHYFNQDSLGKTDLFDEFPKLARALGVSPQYLFCLTDEENSDSDTDEEFQKKLLISSDLRDYFIPIQNAGVEEKPAPEDGDGPDRNIIRIAGRDGSFIERELTDEQIAALKLMLDQFPKVGDL